jgi:glucose uptake protein
MILPQTFGMVLLLLILGMVCLGSWASAFKIAGKFRFELFYIDFAVGAMILALIYAFTVGNSGYDGFSIMDDLSHSGKRQWFYGLLAGVIFNFGNMLLMSSVSVSGMTVAFPVAFGTALTLSTIVGIIGGPLGNTTLLATGCVLLVLAIIVDAIANNMLGVLRHEVLARAGKVKSTRRPKTFKGVILAIVGGLLLGAYSPLIDSARAGEVGMGPFSLAVMFTLGLFFSTFVFSIFFINLPVEGEPAEIGDYLKATFKTHGKGMLAGAVWSTGTVALWVTAVNPDLLKQHRELGLFLSQGAPLVAALWGLLVWKEFRDGDVRVKSMAALMLILLAVGLVMLSVAPTHMPQPT